MSNMKDMLKNKLRTGRESAHAQLIDPATNVNVNTNVNINKGKKKKFEDTHTRATYYIENDLLELLNQVAGNEKGEKTRIVNDALRAYLTQT